MPAKSIISEETGLERELYLTGVANIETVFPVDNQNILLPHLYIKLGIMKNFGKAMGKCNSYGLAFLIKSFQHKPTKTTRKKFVGSQIREVLKDPWFEKSLSKLKLRAWQAFK